MRGKRRSHLLVLLFIVLAAARPDAQGPARRAEVFWAVGVSRMGGDEGSLGSGPHVLGGLGVHVFRGASIEVDVMRAQHDRQIAGGPLEGTATAVFGSGVYHFSEGQTQVFVMGSMGLLRSETTHTFPFGGTPTTFRADHSDFAWGGGGGVKFFLMPRLSVRPQFRLVFSGVTGVSGLAATSIGIGYHW